MKERVIISISSVHGTHHFQFDKWLRRLLKGVGYCVLIALLVVGSMIFYLKHEADVAKNKQYELEQASKVLNREMSSLKAQNGQLESDLVQRDERIHTVVERLDGLEKVLGAEELPHDHTLDARLDAIAVASSVRSMMLSLIPSGTPVDYRRISSGYGKRIHPITGRAIVHRGLDFAVDMGTPIHAPADGVVEVIRPSRTQGSGNFLRLQHAYGFSSSYSHMQKFAVKTGDFVQKGDVIGYTGNSGLSTGPHLHYEVRFVSRPLNPRPFIDWGMDNFETLFSKVGGIRWESLVSKIELRASKQLQLSSPGDVQLADSSS